MSLIYLLARIYPYWALAVGMVLMQLAIFFRRRKNPMQFTMIGSTAILGIGVLAWFYFRGDLHSDEWVSYMLGR
jgi:hypothetical protein